MVCAVQGECEGCLSCAGNVRLQGARCGDGLVGAYCYCNCLHAQHMK